MKDLIFYQPDFFSDNRGDLWTLWKKDNNLEFNHDKVSVSKKNVLRGLHGDSKSWKLITCLQGEIFLTVVDYRTESKTFLQTKEFIINSKNKQIVIVPPNFLNGHLVLSETAVFFYKWSYEGNYPDVDEQTSVRWNSPKLDISWPIKNPILSERDKNSKYLL